MRPKYALWLAAALTWLVWYANDPQARSSSTSISAADHERRGEFVRRQESPRAITSDTRLAF